MLFISQFLDKYPKPDNLYEPRVHDQLHVCMHKRVAMGQNRIYTLSHMYAHAHNIYTWCVPHIYMRSLIYTYM